MIKPELSLIGLGPAWAQFRLENDKLMILIWLSHLVATPLHGTCDFRGWAQHRDPISYNMALIKICNILRYVFFFEVRELDQLYY